MFTILRVMWVWGIIRLKGLSLVVGMIFLFIFVPALLYAGEKVRVVEGIVESVIDDSIKVRGKFYKIADVTLMDASDNELSRDRLQRGRKVSIFFKGNDITSVLIFQENMLQ